MPSRPKNLWLATALASLALFACSDEPLVVGDAPEGTEDAGSEDRSDDERGGDGDDDPARDDRLKAHIARVGGMRVSIVTLSCSGECVDVQAVAEGGNPPYAFVWQDGMRTATRSLCPTEEGTFTVTASDTPVLDGEFTYEGQQTTAEVRTEVLACPDAGPAPSADAGERDDCLGIGIHTCSVPFVPARYGVDLEGRVLRAGQSYELRYDAYLGAPGTIRVFAATATCGLEEELLSVRPENTDWLPGRFCIKPTRDLSQVTFDYLYDSPLGGAGPGLAGGYLCQGCSGP